MNHLTNKEKEMFHNWSKLFGKDTPKYNRYVERYLEEKKKIEEFLKGKKGK